MIVQDQASSDTFFVIDFDRCLSDTDRIDEVYYDLVEKHPDLDADYLREQRARTEDNGGSFNQITELQKKLSPEEIKLFFENFIQDGLTHDLLAYGARDFLHALDEHRIAYGIVSYGHPDWQTVKIKASGLAVIPALIIDHSHKGEVIASWQQTDKSFVIPPALTMIDSSVRVKHVVLLDDKAGAFGQLPKEARGYWIKSVTRSLLPSQQGSIPDNVKTAHGFDEVRKSEAL
ncbi:hypothetical protein BH10PAT4_BH10PAT4_1200 [soil metagenome]